MLIAKRYELVISLYWTRWCSLVTLQVMHNLFCLFSYAAKHLLRASAMSAVLGSALLGGTARAGGHEAVSADAAAQAISQGAVVVDVRSDSRFAQGHLPQATRLVAAAGRYSSAALARAVSDAGVDLSRTVVLVGEPGDLEAQALWRTLSVYARGRVLWLVGGIPEWQMTGRSLSTQSFVAKAVPQHLVALRSEPAQSRMAGFSLRESHVSVAPAQWAAAQ